MDSQKKISTEADKPFGIASAIAETTATCLRRKTMGDSIIFMAGIAVGSLVTIFILMVALISDDIREQNK